MKVVGWYVEEDREGWEVLLSQGRFCRLAFGLPVLRDLVGLRPCVRLRGRLRGCLLRGSARWVRLLLRMDAAAAAAVGEAHVRGSRFWLPDGTGFTQRLGASGRASE